MLAVLYCTAALPAVAQDNGNDPWGGTVEVSTSTLTVPAGTSLTYRLRLTEEPTADGWWVRVRVDGEVRADGRA